ncbi:MAG: hypothetical protein PVH80_07815, partial [Anaerolineae bacterium]
MGRITCVLAVPAVGAHYYTDLAALQDSPIPLSDPYTANPVSPGFRRVREVAEAVSVGLVLTDKRVAWGDCVGVAYSGKAGRDPVFRAASGLGAIHRRVLPALEGREITTFREMAAEIETLTQRTRVPTPQRSEFVGSQGAHDRGLSRRDLL